MHTALITVAVAVTMAAAPAAQHFTREQHRLLPFAEHGSAAAADFDNDGDLDLALRGAGLQLLENDGTGRFTPRASQAVAGVALATGDVDGDGDHDVVVGGGVWITGYLPASLLRNDGNWTFTDVSSQWPATNEASTRVLLVDWDGDGDLDILTGNRYLGQIVAVQPIDRLYLNNGAGVFTDVTSARLPSFTSPALAAGDLDGDGDLDVVYGDANSSATVSARVHVLLQNASGVAVESVNAVPAMSVLPGGFTDIALVDLDLDGDLDLAAASTQGVQVFANNGTGSFVPTGTLVDDRIAAFTVADVDRDGRSDLIAARAVGYSFAPTALPWRHYRSTTSGLVDATALQVEVAGLAPSHLLAFDADGDQDVDVLGAVPGQGALWHGDGQGRLLQLATRELVAPRVVAVAAADADHDGDLDLALIEEAGFGTRQLSVVSGASGRAPGNARRVVVPWTSTGHPTDVAWVDVDHDGDGDLFAARAGGFASLFHDVNGVYIDVTVQHLPAVSATSSVSTADVDGDGHEDLLLGGLVGNYLRGTGTGGFVDASALLPAGAPGGMVALDVDGDGDLDLAQALASPWSGNAPLRVLRNDGPVPFVDVTNLLGVAVANARAVATMDVDGDGRRDLLVGCNTATNVGLVVLRATGSGFVDETTLRVPPMPLVGSITLVDLDGDGDEDLACHSGPGSPLPPLRNDGGFFVPFPATGWSYLDVPERPAAGDFDRDGDQDLVLWRGLYRNVARDLADAVPPRLGLPAELVLRAHAGDGTNAQLALLLLAPALAPQPLPLGSLGALALDPATTMLHSVHTIAATGGEATVAYSVGSAPALLGATVHAQAVFLHTPQRSSWRLGNALELAVRL